MNDPDKSRITLAIAFMVTYSTIIFSLPNFLDISTIDGFNIRSFLIALVYAAFVFLGIVILMLFFIYILVSAHGLAYGNNLEWILNKQESEKIKKYTFNNAVRLIYMSLYMAPGMAIGVLFSRYNSSLVEMFILKYRIVLILVSIIFLFLLIFVRKDENKK